MIIEMRKRAIFRCPAPGTDVITAAYRLVHRSLGLNSGAHNAGEGLSSGRLDTVLRQHHAGGLIHHLILSPHWSLGAMGWINIVK